MSDSGQLSFRHGVHPADNKALTESKPIQRMPFVKRYTLPLSQHIGGPSTAIVSKGDRVERGQCLANASGFVSTALHAPVTGTVVAIELSPAPNGQMAPAIIIDADPYDDQTVRTAPTVDPSTLSVKEWVAHVQKGGLVGLGGAAFPTHVKYAVPEGKKVRHLVVNGCECEPYLTCDHRMMLEHSADIIRGIEIAAGVLGATDSVVGIETNKLDAIAALRAAGGDVRVQGLETKYPQGAEKMLVSAIFDLEIAPGKLPLDYEMLVNNVSTMATFTDWFDRGIPMIERAVTVSGPGVVRPQNLMVPIGTPISEVLAACGGLKDDTKTLVMGGPMMGMPLGRVDVPVVKGTSGLLAFTESADWVADDEWGCIRCGRCLDACAYDLNPSRLAMLSRAERWDEMQRYWATDCMECGACSYTCPSGIPLVHLIRVGKSEIRKLKDKAS